MNVRARVREYLAGRDLLTSILGLLAVIAVGVLAGTQYMMPDKRVLGAAAAVVLVGIAWRLDMVTALGVFLLSLPFPRYTTFGTTNIAFALLLAVIWLLRYTQREAAAPHRTPLDAPIALMIVAYVLSLYNVESAKGLQQSLIISATFLATLILYYMISSNVRSESDLRRLHAFQLISIGAIYAFSFWELAFPGSVLIPGWIDLRSAQIDLQAVERTLRIGGPWRDFELLSEFAALNQIFFTFLIAQSRSSSRRVVYSLFVIAGVVIQFATVTRGGFTALLVGLAYLLFLIRRRVNVVSLTILGVVVVIGTIVIATTLREYTSAGDLFGRLGQTRLVHGMPDSRADVWPLVWRRWMQHPILGNGPYYSLEKGLERVYWPHNLPLFLGNCFGFLGLGIYVWMMVRLWKLTRPVTDRLDDSNYAAAYLLVARVQLLIFMVDEMKIEYLRNHTYTYQVWIIFTFAVAAASVASRVASTVPARVPMPGLRAAQPVRS